MGKKKKSKYKVNTKNFNDFTIKSMNIFVLDEDPVLAAIYQCDKHVVKMIVESAQMLCTAHRVLDGIATKKLSQSGKTQIKYWDLSNKSIQDEEIYYKAVHINHPCSVWVRNSKENYLWLYKHFISLCDEYKHRYKKTHKTDSILREILNTSPSNIPDIRLTEFALAMNAHPECIIPDNTVQSYREYYIIKQTQFKMTWTNREIPHWFK